MENALFYSYIDVPIEMPDSPNAPPISAPLVGILTLTIPQSDPKGLQNQTKTHHTPVILDLDP